MSAKSTLPTIVEEWQEFKERVYSRGMVPEQEKQIKNAFYAGSLVLLEKITEISEKYDENLATVILTALDAELKNHFLSMSDKVKHE